MSQPICLDPKWNLDYENLVCSNLEYLEPPNVVGARHAVPLPNPTPIEDSYRASTLLASILAGCLFGPKGCVLGGVVALFACSDEAGNPVQPQQTDAGRQDTGAINPDSGAIENSLPPHPPHFMSQQVFATSPCGTGGFIPDLDDRFGTCANYATNHHHLFRWDPTAAGLAESVAELGTPPDQVLQDAAGNFFITVYGYQGLVMVDASASSMTEIPFPNLPITGQTAKGLSISSLAPSFAKGLVEIAGRLFIATSNFDPAAFDYLPGTILVRESNGNFSHILTQGFNPTSLATQNGLLFVVTTGAMTGGTPSTHSYFEIYNASPPYNRLQSIDLGLSSAGVAGEMAISADGKTVVLPTADNSGRILVLNLQNNQVREISLPVSSAASLLSTVQISANSGYAFVGNYNDGKLYVVDLKTGNLVENAVVVDTNTGDLSGISDGIISGSNLFLGVGPEIVQVNF